MVALFTLEHHLHRALSQVDFNDKSCQSLRLAYSHTLCVLWCHWPFFSSPSPSCLADRIPQMGTVNNGAVETWPQIFPTIYYRTPRKKKKKKNLNLCGAATFEVLCGPENILKAKSQIDLSSCLMFQQGSCASFFSPRPSLRRNIWLLSF